MTKISPFGCDIRNATPEQREEYLSLIAKDFVLPPYTYNYYGFNEDGAFLCFDDIEYAKDNFTRIIPIEEGIRLLKGEEEKPTEKTLTISDVMALLPSSEIIESNGIEGGLRDGELQMFWEGAEWLKKYIENKLTPKPTE